PAPDRAEERPAPRCFRSIIPATVPPTLTIAQDATCAPARSVYRVYALTGSGRIQPVAQLGCGFRQPGDRDRKPGEYRPNEKPPPAPIEASRPLFRSFLDPHEASRPEYLDIQPCRNEPDGRELVRI